MSNNTMLYALYRMGYHGRATRFVTKVVPDDQLDTEVDAWW